MGQCKISTTIHESSHRLGQVHSAVGNGVQPSTGAIEKTTSLRDSVDACLVNAVDRRFSVGGARPLGLVVARPYDRRAGTLGQDLDRGDIVAHG